MLRSAGIEPSGFVAPHGRFNRTLLIALEMLGVTHSSEFGLAYDELPFAVGSGAVLQIPIHPVCLEIFLEAVSVGNALRGVPQPAEKGCSRFAERHGGRSLQAEVIFRRKLTRDDAARAAVRLLSRVDPASMPGRRDGVPLRSSHGPPRTPDRRFAGNLGEHLRLWPRSGARPSAGSMPGGGPGRPCSFPRCGRASGWRSPRPDPSLAGGWGSNTCEGRAWP